MSNKNRGFQQRFLRQIAYWRAKHLGNTPQAAHRAEPPTEESVATVVRANPELRHIGLILRAAYRLDRLGRRSERVRKPAPRTRAALVAKQKKYRPGPEAHNE